MGGALGLAERYSEQNQGPRPDICHPKSPGIVQGALWAVRLIGADLLGWSVASSEHATWRGAPGLGWTGGVWRLDLLLGYLG